MPLYKTISVNSQTTVKIWKIEESFNDLFNPEQLKPESLSRVNGMKSELHQRGFLSVRQLLKAGIDIEKQREKIKVIAHKFVDYEFKYLDTLTSDYINKLTVIWGIKESLYKLFATPGMLFREHFLVIPFTMKDENTVAWIDYKGTKKRYSSSFLEFEGFTCAYAIEE